MIRRTRPLLRQSRFLHGNEVAKGVKDVTWLRADGVEMSSADWANGINRSVALLLADGKSALWLVVNSYHEGVAFKVPEVPHGGRWRLLVDTERGIVLPNDVMLPRGKDQIVAGRSLTLYERAAG